MPKVATGQPLRSVDRLLEVLGSFSLERPVRTAVEISQELALAPSTVRRLLVALDGHGLIRQVAGTNTFQLALACDQLATLAWVGQLVPIAAEHVDRAHAASTESVTLAVLDGAEGVHVATRRGAHFLSAYNPVGHRVVPYEGGAIGKVLMAWITEAHARGILPASGAWPARTDRAPGDTETFLRSLDAVRRRGHATNNAETDEDVWAVAAPVWGNRGRSLAALHIAVPRSRASRERRTFLTELTVRTAKDITVALG